MQYKYRYMNSQNSVCYRIRITFVRSNTSSTHIKQHYTNVPVTVRKNKHRLACIWVKCGFLSAATSAFYTFKIRRSADPHFTPGLCAEHERKNIWGGDGCKKLGTIGDSGSDWWLWVDNANGDQCGHSVLQAIGKKLCRHADVRIFERVLRV